MADIEKGRISQINPDPVDRNGDPTTAQIIPSTKDGDVTQPLVIDWRLRGKMGDLKPGDEVVYVEFEDYTGYIFGRCNGEWTGIVPGDVTLTGTGTVEDMITEQVPSYNGHVHEGVHGTTSGPR